MACDEPDVTTVPSKGKSTIPSRLRTLFGHEQETKLMVVPTEYGLVMQTVDLPSIAEFQQRVEDRAETIDLSADEVTRLVHGARGGEE